MDQNIRTNGVPNSFKEYHLSCRLYKLVNQKRVIFKRTIFSFYNAYLYTKLGIAIENGFETVTPVILLSGFNSTISCDISNPNPIATLTQTFFNKKQFQ